MYLPLLSAKKQTIEANKPTSKQFKQTSIFYLTATLRYTTS